MVISSIKNQYRGINAHLNSLLQQQEGGWDIFHSHHSSDIEAQANRQLLGTNYIAHLEKGLQIRRADEFSQPESDLLIWQTKSQPASASTIALAELNFAYKPLNAIPILEGYEEYFASIAIYKIQDKTPVAWVELLSPSNKKGGRHFHDYLRKRSEILSTQSVCYVEIDYLHQSSPTIAEIPDYSKNKADAMPYHAAIIDTRRSMDNALAFRQEFGVDEPIPPIQIPLLEKDVLSLNLDAAYQLTYTRTLYGVLAGRATNYRTLPPNFNKYSLSDQQKIIRRMLTVIDAAQNGIDLEGDSVPLPIDESKIQTLLGKQYPLFESDPTQVEIL